MGDVRDVTLRVVAEGEMEIVGSRVHVGGVALSELIDNLPSGRYVEPGRVRYGKTRVTVEILKPVAA